MKNIAIFIDFKGNELSSYSTALLGFANSLLGSDITFHLFTFAAPPTASIIQLKGNVKCYQIKSQKSLFADRSELTKLCNKLSEEKVDEVWFSKSNTSDSLASIISATLDFQIVPNIKQITSKGQSYTIQKSIFSGKATALLEVIAANFIGIFPKGFGSDSNSNSDFMNISFESLDLDTNLNYTIEKMDTHEGSIPLPEASIVVGAGRGMKDPGNWGIIEELAHSLHVSIPSITALIEELVDETEHVFVSSGFLPGAVRWYFFVEAQKGGRFVFGSLPITIGSISNV